MSENTAVELTNDELMNVLATSYLVSVFERCDDIPDDMRARMHVAITQEIGRMSDDVTHADLVAAALKLLEG